MKRLSLLILLFLSLTASAGQWKALFAYNNVSQITMSDQQVYALSNGSIFSVDKQTEELHTYDAKDGLHSTGISCIAYDSLSHQLLIAYATGKIDLLSDHGTRYIGDLYDKDMTQQKSIYNITFHHGIAYLSCHFGIVTLDLSRHEFVDAYWIGSNGRECRVDDVLIRGDSIYAFAQNKLYVAALSSNLSDYHFWHAEEAGRVTPDTEKGKVLYDVDCRWLAGGEEGLVAERLTERRTYIPDGPLNNIPYRLTCAGGYLYVVSGGRWSSGNQTPGCVMRFDGQKWSNITNYQIRTATGRVAKDFMNVAVDPADRDHYFVTSYGTGLYEFRGSQLVNSFLPAEDNTLGSAVPGAEANYTRLDGACYDPNGMLWLVDAGDTPYQLVAMDAEQHWYGIPFAINGMLQPVHTPQSLIIDRRNPNHKWVVKARAVGGILLLDDRGTLSDSEDDQLVLRADWITPDGKVLVPDFYYAAMQTDENDLWIGTNVGAFIIPSTVDFFTSNECRILSILDDNGDNILADNMINAFCQDGSGRVWVGTTGLGVYVMSTDGSEVLDHFTPDNSSMPSATVLSLAYDSVNNYVYVGTADGLVLYSEYGFLAVDPSDEEPEETLDEGTMGRWRVHYSYATMDRVVVGDKSVYGLASGALFSVDKQSEELTLWSKSNGLNSSNILQICYDKREHKLVVIYSDGRIDLIDDRGRVESMIDLYLKANSMSVTVQDITIGERYAYLAMPFGIVVLDTRRTEIHDTYYIGDEASDVDVRSVLQVGDTLYAITATDIYMASVKSSLSDYVNWTHQPLPVSSNAPRLCSALGRLYLFADKRIYEWKSSSFVPVANPEQVAWIHGEPDRLYFYQQGVGLSYLSADGSITPVDSQYTLFDAESDGQDIWMAVESRGLIRWRNGSVQFHSPNGPLENNGYAMQSAGGNIYVVPGGRWTSFFGRKANLSVFMNEKWKPISYYTTRRLLGGDFTMLDACDLTVDPRDPRHFYVSTYTVGVVEFRYVDQAATFQAQQYYDQRNSSIQSTVPGVPNYVRTGGIVMDDEQNLWVINAGDNVPPLHVMSSDGTWTALNVRIGSKPLHFTTPGHLFVDRRDSRFKWAFDQRATQGVICFYDNGTPSYGGDDQCVKRNSWVDQDGIVLSPYEIYDLKQDLKNNLWIATPEGLIILDASTDFMSSNRCRRIKIPRNDGTNLADYLLGTERVNCIAIDGGNRKWFGTQSSGLYLMSEDGLTTLAHFTTDNSLLPSNTIQSLAINDLTGEVFVGTGSGIVSYRSDASQPREDYTSAYVYPNPVRHDYVGLITMAGLMDNSMVTIIDGGGNVVARTRSNGGIAVWDGRDEQGRRVTSGVYTALCNAGDGKGHCALKILFIH